MGNGIEERKNYELRISGLHRFGSLVQKRFVLHSNMNPQQQFIPYFCLIHIKLAFCEMRCRCRCHHFIHFAHIMVIFIFFIFFYWKINYCGIYLRTHVIGSNKIVQKNWFIFSSISLARGTVRGKLDSLWWYFRMPNLIKKSIEEDTKINPGWCTQIKSTLNSLQNKRCAWILFLDLLMFSWTERWMW